MVFLFILNSTIFLSVLAPKTCTYHMYKLNCQFQMAFHEQAFQLLNSIDKLTPGLEQTKMHLFHRQWQIEQQKVRHCQ